MVRIATDAREERSSYIDDEFHIVYPSRFKPSTRNSARGRARRIVRNLDSSVIAELKADEVNQLVDFVADVIAKRYSAAGPRQRLLTAAKVKIDEVALDEVIQQFESNLRNDVAEAAWGNFLRKNLFMVDSKYIGIVPELNVVLASQRRVDFGLFDSDGYLDLFEIKKASTNVLAAREDRGNFYWHADAVKAITQAEKYLYNAERKAPALADDLKRERGVDVEIVRPKAVVILGNSAQFTTPKQRTDFRILRESLRNVEVVLYDEMLTRLRNQRSKVYSSPDVDVDSAKKAAA